MKVVFKIIQSKYMNPNRNKTHKKLKSRQLITPMNHFSQKYIQYTKQKLPGNMKRPMTPNRYTASPRDMRFGKKKRLVSPSHEKTQKINIKMDVKHINPYGTIQNNSTKKKIHKKTISCLSSALHKHPLPGNEPKNEPKPLQKHHKTKSQQNIAIKPKEWGNFLARYTPYHHQGVVTKFAVVNRCGFCPEKADKINQDTYIVIENFLKNNRYLFGVFDGHGSNGHYISEFIKQILPQNIEYFFLKNKNIKKQTKGNIERSLKEAFQKTSKNLMQSGIDIMFSGTTACLVYIQSDTLYCANLGDSRAVIYSKSNQNEEWSFQELSIDHKAEDRRQAGRIEMNGGRIFPYQDEDGQPVGPSRVWIQHQNIPGLAMTRSFGDYVASTVGVIDEPEIYNYPLMKENKFMIIASDGLWQFITMSEVLNIVTASYLYNDAERAGKQLEKAAVQAWQRQDDNIDDITIQVIFLKYY